MSAEHLSPLENARLAVEFDIRDGRRVWAAFMLARTVDVCESILLGRPVRVDLLDPVPLRRALRGGEPPAGDDYIVVTAAMLDAIDECGAFVIVRKGRR